MNKFLIAGNWKMNLLPSQAVEYCKNLSQGYSWDQELVGVTLAMPSTHLALAAKVTKELNISLAAQNIHWQEKGAFTGEISIPMLKDLGVEWTLIGHSERRQYFGETDETVLRKFQACLAHQVIPIVCCGETQEQRAAGVTQDLIRNQLEGIIANIDQETVFIIAYEPIWAIGTGLTASNEQAQEVHSFIRMLLQERLGGRARDIKILYGGSVKPDNIGGLLQKKDIDGALIGGASLDPEQFGSMIAKATKLAEQG